MLLDENYYRDLISKLGLPEMPIIKVEKQDIPQTTLQKFYNDFNYITKKLLQFVFYNNIQDLISADFSNDAIMKMKNGILPENIDICLKKPFEYGGELDFSNLFLIKKRPFKTIIDQFIDEQVLNFNREKISSFSNGYELPNVLFVPFPKGIVFLPALKGFVGPGGNTSADIMTEIGSSMFVKSGGF